MMDTHNWLAMQFEAERPRLLQMPVADGILLQERNDGRFMPKDWRA
jgi:hypothetical protein